MKTTVTSKGQVTIPVAIRKKLKLNAGTVLDFDEEADHLRAAVVSGRVPVRELIGIARNKLPGKNALQWLDDTRGVVKLPARSRAR
jgi:AbrB family looped-hinge helix DNA binding protein